MFGSSGSRTSTGSKVTLNVYDLGPHNAYTHEFGIGTYHSGVQVGGREYTFAGGSGVFFHDPKDVPGEATFRESVELGIYTGTSMALDKILDTLKPQFSEDSYNLVSKNCNHFSDAFVFALLNVRIPGYINRLANLGNMVSCLIPPSLLGQAPVGQGGGGGSGSGSSGGSSGYQVSTPMSRRMGAAASTSSSSSQVFSRAGFTLGSGSGTSSTTSSGGQNANDQREKMRAAALSRLGK